MATPYALSFMRSEKSDCTVDNIHLEKYVENMLKICLPFTQLNSHLNIMT